MQLFYLLLRMFRNVLERFFLKKVFTIKPPKCIKQNFNKGFPVWFKFNGQLANLSNALGVYPVDEVFLRIDYERSHTIAEFSNKQVRDEAYEQIWEFVRNA